MRSKAVQYLLASSKKTSKALAIYRLICRYWLLTGFAFFICGLFITSSWHNYKLAINYLMMLPSLIVVCVIPRWWSAAVRCGTLLLPVLSYLAYMVANAYFQNAGEGLPFLLHTVYIIVFLIAAGLCLDAPLHRISQTLWLGAVVASTAVLYATYKDFLSGAMMQHGYRLSGYGALYNPLRSGHLFGVFFIVAMWCVLMAPITKAQRFIAAICAAVLLAAILLTGSRSPLVALLLVATLTVIAVPKYRFRLYVSLFLFLIAASLLGFVQVLLERGWSLRPELWQLTLSKVVHTPWFGVGLGNEILLNTSTGEQFHDPHNVFLAALYYGGIIGLLLFMICFGAGFWIAWSRRERSPQFWIAALLQLFGIATLLFDGSILILRPGDSWLLYWLPIALTLHALRTLPLREPEPERNG